MIGMDGIITIRNRGGQQGSAGGVSRGGPGGVSRGGQQGGRDDNSKWHERRQN